MAAKLFLTVFITVGATGVVNCSETPPTDCKYE